MGLRISTNVASEVVQKNLQQANVNQQQAMEKLSSGSRINKAADDAAGMAIATNLKAQNRGLQQASRNANDGISLIQTAEGGMNEVSNILIRLRELSVQAASDTIGDQERGYLNKEYQQLTEEIDRIADSTQFNGKALLNGQSDEGTLDFQVGAFGGKENVIKFDVNETNVKTDNIGINGSAVASKEDAQDAIAMVDEAINHVSSQRANLGALQSRLQSTVSNLGVQHINQEAARSTIEDADVAEEAAKLASSNVIKQAGISTLAQANTMPQSALRLVG